MFPWFMAGGEHPWRTDVTAARWWPMDAGRFLDGRRYARVPYLSLPACREQDDRTLDRARTGVRLKRTVCVENPIMCTCPECGEALGDQSSICSKCSDAEGSPQAETPDGNNSRSASAPVKPRKAFVGGLASLIFPGLGHMYVGRLCMGIAFYAGVHALFVCLGLLRIGLSFKGLIVIAATDVLMRVGGVCHVVCLARKNRDYHLKRYNRWFYYLLFAVCLGAAGIARTDMLCDGCLVPGIRAYVMSGVSMSPAISKRDRVIVDLWRYRSLAPQRGDVVVFAPLDVPGRRWVMRVVGLPGKSLSVREGRVWVNGSAISEPYVEPRNAQSPWSTDWGNVVVPEGHIFVLGDNRDRARDSRSVGALPLSNAIGKALYILWSRSMERIGRPIN